MNLTSNQEHVVENALNSTPDNAADRYCLNVIHNMYDDDVDISKMDLGLRLVLGEKMIRLMDAGVLEKQDFTATVHVLKGMGYLIDGSPIIRGIMAPNR